METNKPQFLKAERKQAKVKLAITGPSGSGKTYSALAMAAGLGKKIAVIDTENKSASLYADTAGMPAFDVLEIESPYTTEKYTAAIDAAVAAGYDILVIDSLTHAWAGEGGLLDQKETIDRTDAKGSSYTHWAGITKKHEKLKAKLLQTNIHMIVTMRSKQDYLITEGGQGGKGSVRKVGLAPIQRDGMEYEFAVVFDMVMSHEATISKDRTGLFDGQVFQPSKKTGETIMAWLTSGKAPAPVLVPPKATAAAKAPAAQDPAEQAKEKAIDEETGVAAAEQAATEMPEDATAGQDPIIYRTWTAKGDTRPHAVIFKKNGWRWSSKDTAWTHDDSKPELDKTQPWLAPIGKTAGITITMKQHKSQEFIDAILAQEGGR